MNHQVPEKIYRFLDLQNLDRIQELLLDSKLYFARPGEFNDPFEFRPQTHDSEIEGVDSELTQKYIAPSADFLHKIIYKELNNFGACCFTEKSLDINMWSHYAESHKGICVEFDTNNDYFKLIKKVCYKAGRHKFEKKSNHGEDIVYKIMLRKNTSWEYEGEWRLLRKPGGEAVTFDPLILTGIIFGVNCTEQSRKLIRKLLEPRDINYFETQIGKFEFKLNLHAIS